MKITKEQFLAGARWAFDPWRAFDPDKHFDFCLTMSRSNHKNANMGGAPSLRRLHDYRGGNGSQRWEWAKMYAMLGLPVDPGIDGRHAGGMSNREVMETRWHSARSPRRPFETGVDFDPKTLVDLPLPYCLYTIRPSAMGGWPYGPYDVKISMEPEFFLEEWTEANEAPYVTMSGIPTYDLVGPRLENDTYAEVTIGAQYALSPIFGALYLAKEAPITGERFTNEVGRFVLEGSAPDQLHPHGLWWKLEKLL